MSFSSILPSSLTESRRSEHPHPRHTPTCRILLSANTPCHTSLGAFNTPQKPLFDADSQNDVDVHDKSSPPSLLHTCQLPMAAFSPSSTAIHNSPALRWIVTLTNSTQLKRSTEKVVNVRENRVTVSYQLSNLKVCHIINFSINTQ